MQQNKDPCDYLKAEPDNIDDKGVCFDMLSSIHMRGTMATTKGVDKQIYLII